RTTGDDFLRQQESPQGILQQRRPQPAALLRVLNGQTRKQREWYGILPKAFADSARCRCGIHCRSSHAVVADHFARTVYNIGACRGAQLIDQRESPQERIEQRFAAIKGCEIVPAGQQLRPLKGSRTCHRSSTLGDTNSLRNAGMSRGGASSAAANFRSASADNAKRVCSLSARSAASRAAASIKSPKVLPCSFAARVRRDLSAAARRMATRSALAWAGMSSSSVPASESVRTLYVQ